MNTHLTEMQANVRNIGRATGHSPLWAFLGDAPQVCFCIKRWIPSDQTVLPAGG